MVRGNKFRKEGTPNKAKGTEGAGVASAKQNDKIFQFKIGTAGPKVLPEEARRLARRARKEAKQARWRAARKAARARSDTGTGSNKRPRPSLEQPEEGIEAENPTTNPRSAMETGAAEKQRIQTVQRNGVAKPGKKTLKRKKVELEEPTGPAARVKLVPVLAQPDSGSIGNSNWAALRALIGAGQQKRARSESGALKPAHALGSGADPTPVVAVDCEMVGVGPDGDRSSLARICVVNDQGNVLMDKYVQQKERVTDYRTRWSGIRPADLNNGKAVPLLEIQQEAAALFKDRILVGHAIHNDLQALLLSHPGSSIRDTARYPPLMSALPGGGSRARSLKHLASEVLGLDIQAGEHSPVEDARAALYLYQRHEKEWEKSLRNGTIKSLQSTFSFSNPKGKGRSLAALAARDSMVDL